MLACDECVGGDEPDQLDVAVQFLARRQAQDALLSAELGASKNGLGPQKRRNLHPMRIVTFGEQGPERS
jgi:hypothetical protein